MFNTNHRVYQDSRGTMGVNKAQLVPPLVRVRQVLSRIPGTMDAALPCAMDMPWAIFSGLKQVEHGLRFEFSVRPARRLCGVYFQGYGGTVRIDQTTPCMLFSMRQAFPRAETPTFFPLTLPPCNVRTFQVEVLPKDQNVPGDIVTSVRFVFDDIDMRSDAQPTSVGVELQRHTASKDFTIVTPDGMQIMVHRSVLASQSPFFDRLLNGGFEQVGDVYTAREGGAASWGNLVRFVYDRVLENKGADSLFETMQIGYFCGMPTLVACAWAAVSQPRMDKFVAVTGMRLAAKGGDTVVGNQCWGVIKALFNNKYKILVRDVAWMRAYTAMLEEIGGMPTEWRDGDSTEEYDASCNESDA